MSKESLSVEQITRPCDHCEQAFRADYVTPVLIAGVQSYLGHLLTGKPGIRAVYLCTAICLPNLMGANIEGMHVEVDEDRVKRRGPIPSMSALSPEEEMDFAGAEAQCSGLGVCMDSEGTDDPLRRLTHEMHDESARTTAYCYLHTVRAYSFHLRRWAERQRSVQ